MLARGAIKRPLIAIALTAALVGLLAASPVAAQDADTSDDAPSDGGDQPAPDEDNGSSDAESEDDQDADDAEDVPVEEQREESLSVWWVIVAIIAAVLALAGIAMGLRRRQEEEAWDEAAANLCNAGRSVLGSVRRSIHGPTTEPTPDAVRSRLEKFSAEVNRLVDATPHARAERSMTAVSQATGVLIDAWQDAQLDAVGDDATRSLDEIDLAVATLDVALTDLEREASLGAAGA